MKDILTGVSRILVGTLFIFSGIIKANDPLGFSYKLEEYWVEFGIAWDWLLAIGPVLSSFICIFEIVLGAAILVVYRFKIATLLMLLMIGFFTILTFASAVFGLVKTCGCFGDAFVLTPWQSFIKDLVLMAFIIILYKYRNEVKSQSNLAKSSLFVIIPTAIMAYISFNVGWTFPLYFMLIILVGTYIGSFVSLERAKMIAVSLSLLGSIYLCYYTIAHLPLKDFRPYAMGKSIPEQMKLPEGAKPDVYDNVFKYKNLTTGDVEEFNESSYPWDDENYEFVDRVTTLIEKGDAAKITDFSIVDETGYDLTEDVLYDPDPILMIICYNIGLATTDETSELVELVESCKMDGMTVMGLSASDDQLIKAYLEKTGLDFDFFATDEITLKTMVRSNPGIILLKEGIILDKWHINDVPSYVGLQRKL